MQVKTFSRDNFSQYALAQMKKYDSGIVKKISTKNKILYKAWLGPYANKLSANKVASKIKSSGKSNNYCERLVMRLSLNLHFLILALFFFLLVLQLTPLMTILTNNMAVKN